MIWSVLALASVTLIFVRGSIFKAVRALYPALLACPLCIGFWVGLAGSFRALGVRSVLSLEGAVDHFLFAAVISVSALALHLVLLRVEGE